MPTETRIAGFRRVNELLRQNHSGFQLFGGRWITRELASSLSEKDFPELNLG